MRRHGFRVHDIGVTGIAIPLLLVGAMTARAQSASTWDFEDGQAGQAPAGFSFGRTGQGRLGQWVVKTDPNASIGGHVLAQLDPDGTDFRFPMAVANEPLLADLRLSVKCKPVAGEIDQACGLVFRYQDENNYYVTRANALEGNVRFYKVVKGNRQQFAGWNGAVASGVWHELRVDAQADRFTISWDGKKIIDAHDQTFPDAGRIGLWTKADSVTYFDDLKVEPREP